MSDPERLDPSRGVIARYAARLRELRIERGLTRAEVADRVFLSYSAIAKFESGTRFPLEDVAQLLDEVLGADGALFDLWGSVSDTPHARWASRLEKLEAGSREIRHLAGGVPALLQTEAYIRSILGRGMELFGGNLEEKVQFRLRRCDVLHSADPPALSTVVSEAALRMVVESPRVMREQLRHLLRMSERPYVSLRIIPFTSQVFSYIGQATLLFPRVGKPTLYTVAFEQGVFSTKPSEVAWHASLYDHIYNGALSEETSRAFISKVIEDEYHG
ncbi:MULTISPECIES: helix-turn-helix domain-containing protein [Streptomyces]|uniref:helix-turn-helix domain-containing protein n=1 Tax=Streptomyces TaxID=1883 RepID=UPI00163C4056|nr:MULTISPECIES: helix-turn-helix transcriptional regulator [Streptomyces]MBC2874204.1 helix-turn-helix transcriptional regulator [Streptomyces sp. TYQ1024]UBI40246.1 helix-turn-helix transcriptional regulator [Streptomyces mobaraensis]UKW32824.1 helix-turn-helix transcriptional regulator [Streptomyces sp. TYQ1024]